MLELICAGSLTKCRVIKNLVEENELPPVCLPRTCPEKLRFVMLGNIDFLKKGYDIAISLAEKLGKECLPIEIHVSGRPDALGRFVSEIERRKLVGTLKYHGETDDPVKFLRTGHAYLLLSRFEGLPNALLEAMSLGLPAIATKVGDLERIASDGVHLKLIRPESLDEAYGAVRSLFENWPEAVELGERGRVWCAENFSSSRWRARLIDVVDALLR